MTDLPEFRLRILGPDMAKLFQGRPNDLGRTSWDMIGRLDLGTGDVTLLQGVSVDPAHVAFCASQVIAFADLAEAQKVDLVAIGQAADALAARDEGIDRGLLDLLLLAIEDVRLSRGQ